MGRAQNTVKQDSFWRAKVSAAGGAAPLSYGEERNAFGNATARGPLAGFMRLTPDSRAPAKADPWKVCVGCNPCSCSGVVVVAVVVVVVVVVVFCCCFCFCCCCGCCCCWPMLALFGRRFAPVLARGCCCCCCGCRCCCCGCCCCRR